MTVAGAEVVADERPGSALRVVRLSQRRARYSYTSSAPPGVYPWPVTTTGEEDDSAVLAAPLAESAPFEGASARAASSHSAVDAMDGGQGTPATRLESPKNLRSVKKLDTGKKTSYRESRADSNLPVFASVGVRPIARL